MPYTCFPRPLASSTGIWLESSPLHGGFSLLVVQITIIVVISYALRSLLRPLNQHSIVSQILTGILLSSAGLGRLSLFRDWIFAKNKIVFLKVVGFLGVVLLEFMVGVKVDVNQVWKLGKRSLTVGFLSVSCPAILTFAVTSLPTINSDAVDAARLVVYVWAPSSIVVCFCLLSEVNLLNSRVGRLAVGATLFESVLESVCGTVRTTSFNTGNMNSDAMVVAMVVTMIGSVAVLYYVVNPLAHAIVRSCPTGPNGTVSVLSEAQFVAVIVTALIYMLLSAYVGFGLALGGFLAGLALPSGHPLGSTFVDRLESLTNIIFFPVFVVITCLQVDWAQLMEYESHLIVVQGVTVLIAVGKAVGVILGCLYFQVPLYDAVTVAVIVNHRGVQEMMKVSKSLDEGASEPLGALIIFNTMLLAAITTPLVKVMYQPSKRYKRYKRRTLEHNHDVELRVLASFHHEESVPPAIRLLEAVASPTDTATAVYVLHLMPLSGRVDPILVPYEEERENMSFSPSTDRIVKAFRNYVYKTSRSDSQNRSFTSSRGGPAPLPRPTTDSSTPHMTVVPFVGISPYNSMFDDVCTVALDHKVSLVLLPFHRLEVDGAVESDNQAFRAMNIDVLRYAPSTVGVLITQGHLKDAADALANPIGNVVVYFVGGADDREALLLATRIGSSGKVGVTLVHFVSTDPTQVVDDHVEDKFDERAVYEFKMKSVNNSALVFREEKVRDGEEVVKTIVEISCAFDLIVVGRASGGNWTTMTALTTWSEYPELGILGDLLASTESLKDSTTLVVQQQPERKGR